MSKLSYILIKEKAGSDRLVEPCRKTIGILLFFAKKYFARCDKLFEKSSIKKLASFLTLVNTVCRFNMPP